MAKIALITGITGQDGPYLAEILLSQGYKVYGLSRTLANPNLYGLIYLGIREKVTLIYGDLNDFISVEKALEEVKPDEIYHLASQSSVVDSWTNVSGTAKTNADANLVFLEYVRKFPQTKLFLAQSSEIFGRNISDHEKMIGNPATPYGVAKLFSYYLGKIYREKYSLFIVNGIFYNHESPLRNINFFSRKVTQTIANILQGKEEKLILGNIDLYRDLGFAADYMAAAVLTLAQDQPADYIIATGEYFLLRDFVKLAFQEGGIDDYEKYICLEKSYFRQGDPLKIKGFPELTFKKLGWKPSTSVAQIVKLMIAHDREFVKRPDLENIQYTIPGFY